ncbi:hypothetical protein BGZ82_011179 [Podila clonocystis]|nr:hypothetical protein BGZ82_011179 [Podila clonocystis]
MAFNFDGTFGLSQAGLELSLNDFAFDPTQASQVQQQLQQQQQMQQQQQQQLMQQQGQDLQTLSYSMNENLSAGSYVKSVSASTTPVFQTNPDKAHGNGTGGGQPMSFQQLQQQHQQQALFLLLLFHQQQQKQALLTPAGSEFYSTNYNQYVSPQGIQPQAPEATMGMTEQTGDEEFTPLISPAMTPSHPYPNLPPAMSTGNEMFSPLTSPALVAHRSSAMDYVSFSGQNFSALPVQFQQAHAAQQQQLQHQMQQFQAHSQGESALQFQLQQNAQAQAQAQTQVQAQAQAKAQADGRAKHGRVVDPQTPVMNGRPPVKRRATAERVTGVASSGGPIRVSVTKSSPVMRPVINATIRKQQPRGTSNGASRPAASIAPASPLTMNFPTSRPTSSPILISTSQPQTSQPSASPSPALFSLPDSSMMPPPSSPMTLPSQNRSHSFMVQRQLNNPNSLANATIQPKGHQMSIHQPLLAPASTPAKVSCEAATPSGSSTSVPLLAPKTTAIAPSSPGGMVAPTLTPRPVAPAPSTSSSPLAPVTPASLMNMGSGSGSDATPTASPTINGYNTSSSGGSKSKQTSKKALAPSTSSTSTSSTSTSSSKNRAKRASIATVPLLPSTPRPLIAGSSSTPMAPPSGGFSLISPALKPTLLPQTHRGSIGSQPILVSPRLQPLLVSPSLKPWLPGMSTTDAMARLATRSNYQNILDGDHTALGLSYNTDLHSGIELRRTSHKAAEQKRRDSLKHCFDDLRQMIPNIVDKAPSKVFLLKKSFDYICQLKATVAQHELDRKRVQIQHEYFQRRLEQWLQEQDEDKQDPLEQKMDEGNRTKMSTRRVPDFSTWVVPDEELKEATAKETEAVQAAEEMAELSAAAVEAARIGNQPGGNKGSNGGGSHGKGGNDKNSQGGKEGDEDSECDEENSDESSQVSRSGQGNYNGKKQESKSTDTNTNTKKKTTNTNTNNINNSTTSIPDGDNYGDEEEDDAEDEDDEDEDAE